MEENFVVVSLEDKKSKNVAKILSNDTARKILTQLSIKRMSISELASKLKVPISTIQYNIDALKEAEFVIDTAYKYSEKGKKILYYEPARKIVILAPKKEEKNIMEKLRMFLIPIIFGIASIGSLIGSKIISPVSTVSSTFAEETVAASAPAVAQEISLEAMPACVSYPLWLTSGFVLLALLSAAFAIAAIVAIIIIIWRWKYGKK